MMHVLSRICLVFPLAALALCGACVAVRPVPPRAPAAARPAIPGPEGERAFADLALFYHDISKAPPVSQALADIESADATERASAGKYLLALAAQSFADERGPRDNLRRRLPAWGTSGTDSTASGFRASLAKELGTRVKAVEALDAALWFVENDPSVENQAAGATVLCRLSEPQVERAFAQLLAQPHPNPVVVNAVLEQVGQRKLTALAPAVRRLCGHYRESIRKTARQVASVLGVQPPAYAPEQAFTPWLDAEVNAIAAMVECPLPATARRVKATVTYQSRREKDKTETRVFSVWLLDDTAPEYRLLGDWGKQFRLARERVQLEPSSLEDRAKELLAVRAKSARDAAEALSHYGGFSAQFEPGFIYLPEGLVAAWLYERGDRRLAAQLLFPRIEAAADDRWIREALRDELGVIYQDEMLEAFCYDRNYARALALAKHLSSPQFAGFRYQERAKELAAQLARRAGDFKTLRLPSAEEWTRVKARLPRPEQVQYLAQRLRLLNCFQTGQPDNIDYRDAQSAEPRQKDGFWPAEYHGPLVINPYVELVGMHLEVGELPALAPFLANDDFMATYGFWRWFHPDRTLHRVSWAVADVMNRTARRDLARLAEFAEQDEAGRRQQLDRILEWCQRNAGKSQKELVLSALAEVTDWRHFRQAAAEAIQLHMAEAVPIVAGRYDQIDRWRDDIVEICFRLDAPDAAPYARRWLAANTSPRPDESPDTEDARMARYRRQTIRFWSTLILLRHGDRAHDEGFAPLATLLADKDGEEYYVDAIEPLLALKNEKAARLACGILTKEHLDRSSAADAVLWRLFLAGRKECLDYLLAALDDETPWNTAEVTRDGKTMTVTKSVRGDSTARDIAEWRTDGFKIDEEAPLAALRAKRQELKAWLQEQFALIQAGKPSAVRPLPGPLESAHWEIDAP